MRYLIILIISILQISSCAIVKNTILPSQVRKITIFAMQAGSYTVVPINRETFVKRTFPNSVKQFSGYKKTIYFHKNKKDSVWEVVNKMQTLGHIDTIRKSSEETGLYENIRIRCVIKTKKETVDVWINRNARSCIKGDSMYICPPVLLRQLCYFVPESNICDYIK
ncbi:MAG: hypothetical protein LC105_01160 [Chitinophagales bacterium]|nr:hypothetical protein [Chitinophagales bacterium]